MQIQIQQRLATRVTLEAGPFGHAQMGGEKCAHTYALESHVRSCPLSHAKANGELF